MWPITFCMCCVRWAKFMLSLLEAIERLPAVRTDRVVLDYYLHIATSVIRAPFTWNSRLNRSISVVQNQILFALYIIQLQTIRTYWLLIAEVWLYYGLHDEISSLALNTSQSRMCVIMYWMAIFFARRVKQISLAHKGYIKDVHSHWLISRVWKSCYCLWSS